MWWSRWRSGFLRDFHALVQQFRPCLAVVTAVDAVVHFHFPIIGLLVFGVPLAGRFLALFCCHWFRDRHGLLCCHAVLRCSSSKLRCWRSIIFILHGNPNQPHARPVVVAQTLAVAGLGAGTGVSVRARARVWAWSSGVRGTGHSLLTVHHHHSITVCLLTSIWC